MLTSHSFRLLAARIKAASQSICDGKIVMTHEGGYSPLGTVSLSGCPGGIIWRPTDVVDPYLQPSQNKTDKLLPHQADAIRAQRMY